MEMDARKTALIFSLSTVARDPRVQRQVAALKDRYRVVVAGFGEYCEDGALFISLGSEKSDSGRGFLRRLSDAVGEGNLAVRLHQELARHIPLGCTCFHTRVKERALLRSGYAAIIRRIAKEEHPSIVIANDFSALVIARAAGDGPRYVYDAHEYTPGQRKAGARRNSKDVFVDYALRKFLPIYDAVVTVSDGIAEEYSREFGIARPTVIINAPRYVRQDPRLVSTGRIRLVHHGVATKSRGIEVLISMMRLLDPQFELDLFLLAPNMEYYDRLVDSNPIKDRIRFRAPVPTMSLSKTLNEYDVGVYCLPPETLNTRMALPNKLFEFVQGRIAVAIGPSPEMASYVEKYGLGVVAEDFTAEAMARALSGLGAADIDRYKANAHAHALELSAEPQMEKLFCIAESLR
jgi:hypothetical protein